MRHEFDVFFPGYDRESLARQLRRLHRGLSVDHGVVREKILESWSRSRKYNVSPRHFSPHIVGQQIWEESMKGGKALITVASKVVDRFLSACPPSGSWHSLYLFNKDGVILKKWQQDKACSGVPERTLCHEKFQGTGSVGLCLLTQSFEYVIGRESWLWGHEDLVSMTMPVFDSSGMTGGLNLTVHINYFHGGCPAFLKFLVTTIEDETRLIKRHKSSPLQIYSKEQPGTMPCGKLPDSRLSLDHPSWTNLQNIVSMAKKAAGSDITLLITGETGTGKDLLARAIHQASTRSERPFVAVNCGALAQNLIESELFGYEDGAFTGALKGGRPGRFELASGGVVFLDEIGEFPLHFQPLLLRVLENGEIWRLGARSPRIVDVRIIAATNRNLEEDVKKGLFRSDLYYRLSTFCLHLPPLRERLDDLDHILMRLLEGSCQHLPLCKKFHPSCMEILRRYSWPGNIRELKNVVEYAVCMSDKPVILPQDLPDSLLSAVQGTPSTAERDKICHALRKAGGNIPQAAALLKISRSGLYAKLKNLGITTHEYKILNQDAAKASLSPEEYELLRCIRELVKSHVQKDSEDNLS